jgi:hypothetical protein
MPGYAYHPDTQNNRMLSPTNPITAMIIKDVKNAKNEIDILLQHLSTV